MVSRSMSLGFMPKDIENSCEGSGDMDTAGASLPRNSFADSRACSILDDVSRMTVVAKRV